MLRRGGTEAIKPDSVVQDLYKHEISCKKPQAIIRKGVGS